MIMINISNNEIPFKKYIKPLQDRWSKVLAKKRSETNSTFKRFRLF